MAANESFSATHPRDPQPGDLIEIFRPAYQHWALYLGDGYIINVTPVEEGPPATFGSAKSVFSRKAMVRMQLLKEVVGSDTYRINNKYDGTYAPLPVEEIIRRAEYLINQEVSYDLLGNNCEHFVTLLRYGEGVSEQICSAVLGIKCTATQNRLYIHLAKWHFSWLFKDYIQHLDMKFFLNTSRNGDSTIALGSLCQCPATLSEKSFLLSNLNLPWHKLKPFPLVLPIPDVSVPMHNTLEFMDFI